MELLAPLPDKEPSTQPHIEPAWTAAELALLYPAVLKHMAVNLGLNVDYRLTGDACDGGTLLHRVFYELRGPVAASVGEACAESLCVLLDAGADPSRCNKGGQTPLQQALLFQTHCIEERKCESQVARTCIRALLSKTAAPSFYAGVQERELSQVRWCQGSIWNNLCLLIFPSLFPLNNKQP